MYLELADNCTNCLSDNNNPMLPVIDDTTGEIYMINAEMFARMDIAEQQEAIAQAGPLLYILEKDKFQGMEGALWNKIKQGVQNFIGKAKEVIGNVTSGQGLNIGATPPQQTTPQFDPRFSMSIEPDPKPWFARPEVLLPIGIGAIGIVYLLTRKK